MVDTFDKRWAVVCVLLLAIIQTLGCITQTSAPDTTIYTNSYDENAWLGEQHIWKADQNMLNSGHIYTNGVNSYKIYVNGSGALVFEAD